MERMKKPIVAGIFKMIVGVPIWGIGLFVAVSVILRISDSPLTFPVHSDNISRTTTYAYPAAIAQLGALLSIAIIAASLIIQDVYY